MIQSYNTVSERENIIKNKKFKVCEFCKNHVIKLTKHSIMGTHRSPFVKLCRDCHNQIHGYREISKTKRIELKQFILNKLKESGYNLEDLPLNSNKGLL